MTIAPTRAVPDIPSNMPAVIEGLLAQTGSTADAVADFLRAKNYKGEPRDASGCPLSNWLHDLGFEIADITPNQVFVQIGEKSWTVATPAHIAEFTRRFDAGVYLDLVELLVVNR